MAAPPTATWPDVPSIVAKLRTDFDLAACLQLLTPEALQTGAVMP